MDVTWLIGGVLVLIVGFFAYQWFMVASTKKPKMRMLAPPAASASGPSGPASSLSGPSAPESPNQYPEVAGQSEAELRQKEPLQRPNPSTQQQPVTNDGNGPADFKENLRRPEQSFHEPSMAPPTLKISDVPAGRAVESNGQGFSPELAQNDGPMVGNSVFAFDGMEPTGFASF
jgi:hypothetical protein